MTVQIGIPAWCAKLSTGFAELDAMVVRRLPTIYVALVAVLFVNDLASQLLHGAVRLAFAGTKDILLLVLLVPATKRLSSVPKHLLWAIGSLLVLVGVAAIKAPSAAAAVLEVRSVYWGLFLLLSAVVLASERTERALSMSLLALGNAGALVAIATYSLGITWVDRVARSGGVIASNYFSYLDPTHPRAFSPFLEPNTLGAAMAVVLVCAIAGPAARFRWHWMTLPLPLVALFLSASRSAALGLILGLTVWALSTRRALSRLRMRRMRLWVAGSLVCLTAGLVVAGIDYASKSGDPSARFHLQTLLTGPHLVVHNLLGLGLGRVGPRATIAYGHALGVESSLLFIALELGVVGLAAFIWLLSHLAARFVEGLKSDIPRAVESGRWGMATLAAALPTIALLGMIQATPIVWLWWLVWGTTYGMIRQSRASR